MKTRILAWAVIALFIALIVSLFFNYKQYRDAQQPPVITSVDTSVEWRDVASEAPQPTFEREVGNITATVKIRPQKEKTGEIAIPKDTTGTTEPPDSVYEVTLPKVQKVYTDSCYTAYVSGYMPQLDSLRIRYPLITTTINKTKPAGQRKINIGVVAGYGYGFRSRQIEPFVGLGISVNLW